MNLLHRVINKIRWIRKKKLLKTAFKNEFDLFSSQSSSRLPLKWDDAKPYLDDKTSTTPFDAHYIYHPAWAARILRLTNPSVHIDISSTLHFSTQLSAFIPVQFYDYRPADLQLDNLTSAKADLLHLPFETATVESISCMHTIEHIGLGRYGDPIDADGDLKAIRELKRVVRKGGTFLFVVPVGKAKIVFNAHRIYDPHALIPLFDGFTLNDFSLVTDKGDFIRNAGLDLAAAQQYGCGCFWFVKD